MKRIKSQAGFTLVELMIATMVFAVILLVVTEGIIKINNTFYKGVNSSNTENVARSVMDDIAQNIQFGGGGISPSSAATYSDAAHTTLKPARSKYTICVGNVSYNVNLGYELQDSQKNAHALVKDSTSGCPPSWNLNLMDGAGPTYIPSSATEMLSRGMRVAALSVSFTNSSESVQLYNIHVRIVYGDDDLLCSPTVIKDCGTNDPYPSYNSMPTDLGCRSGAGSQFCSVADLSTTVEKRTL